MDENQIKKICSTYIKEIIQDAKTSGEMDDADFVPFDIAVRSDFTEQNKNPE